MHIIPESTRRTKPTSHNRVQNNLIPNLDIANRRPDLMHPTRVLMADCVRQLHVGFFFPLAVADVDVGATYTFPVLSAEVSHIKYVSWKSRCGHGLTGSANAHNDVERRLHCRNGNIVHLHGRMVRRDAHGFHGLCGHGAGIWGAGCVG